MSESVIDLFCGVGGFSLGAELAGFKSKLSIDIDTDVTSTWNNNFPNSNLRIGDVAQLDKGSCKTIFDGGRPSGVIGGPPCQGFSRIGKRNSLDPRNSLVSVFFDKVALIKPKFFLMENVEGLLDEINKDVLESSLSKIPSFYKVLPPLRVNSANHGAPTNRKRIILLGYDPDYVDEINEQDICVKPGAPDVTVRDAIYDLPSPFPSIKNGSPYAWSEYKRSALSEFSLRMRAVPKNGLGWDVAISALRNCKVSGVAYTKHTDGVVERFKATEPGKVEKISRYPRLKWDGKCPTLRAGTGKSNGSYQAMRPIHPEEPRVITIREAARLQGFPDWFLFHPTIWHSFRMIGNSVSPILSQSLMQFIRSKL
ncbi:DNA cytosine methyltransferase [Halomonas campisalis]|uniref:Cytosine-specific methyltransferase n=1 Tax=Billgrantia campisalis TaxID=74661 RepID=A0ABS9P9I6_9GAMM|nr:DNA cytosine methyltransferase [Halomonas campisalis]MCG6658444.1 DNA cytosine methyltransferase [Halomonas campisalis]MDR5863115.1 DNA cytosine methyltransferase [Halomonas campisalis]